MASPHSDRISLLPDCILEDILERLPLGEAVRTSVLSKIWISLWTQLSKLVFDKLFCEKSVRRDTDRLMLIISHILFESCKPLLDFTFALNRLPRSDIDQLVQYVSAHGVEYLKLVIPNGELYKFRSLNELHLLKHFTLESCQVKLPCGFRGFSLLKHLYFYDVRFKPGELSVLVSSCPVLETLKLINLLSRTYLNLDAPNLKFLCCAGFVFNLSLKSTPLLKEMTVVLDVNADYDLDRDPNILSDMVVPFGVIPSLRHLLLNDSFLKFMNLGNEKKISRCRDALINIHRIELQDVSFEEIEVSQNILSLIRCSPNLELITVRTCLGRPASEHSVGVWQTANLSEVSLNKLRYVEMNYVIGKKSEQLFIKTLLEKSPMLEVMIIELQSVLTEEEALNIADEIYRFHYVSSRLKIELSVYNEL